MCGITGYIGQFTPDLINNMVNTIKHRGPDGDGVFRDKENHVALGHTRLSIIDLSEGGHQPMVLSGKVAISYNGEIYNYRELRASLEVKGYEFKSTSDTEVLLNAYMEYGTSCFEKFNGIFSIAIWDIQRKKLVLVRDGLGVKPLYYARSSKGILFSSEIKAIMCEPSVNRELDPIAAGQYLTYLWTPESRTMLKSVKKVKPGAILEISTDCVINSSSFYSLPLGIPDETMNENDAVDLVREAVKTAVDRQMIADVEVGAFLSGGLDSSSIVAFANQLTDQKLQCFTMKYQQNEGAAKEMEEDLPYAREVAKALDVDLHEVRVDHTMTDRLVEMIYHLDEPQADPAILNSLFICELAHSCGIKVLLSGAGGDDIFTGYRRHHALSLEKYWTFLPQFARNGIKHISSTLPVNKPLFRKVRKVFDHANLSADERIASYYNWLNPDVSCSLLTHDFRSDMISADIARPLYNSLKSLPKEVPPVNRMLDLDLKYFSTDHNLNYTDKMGMACGVEIRVPLLDKDLVSLASRLPASVKQRGSTGKWVFKKAMEGILPNDVIYRPKTGFGVPLRQWLHGDFGTFLKDELSSQKFRQRGVFDPKQVEGLLDNTFSGKIDGTYALLSLLCQELWCQKFVDN